MPLKCCCECKQMLVRAQFSRDASRPDGLQTRCKDCEAIRSRERYAMGLKTKRGQKLYRNHFDYQWHGMPKWRQRPAERVAAAMERLSRDRWMPPWEVSDVAFRLAACCSAAPGHTAKRWREGLPSTVGLLRGKPPLNQFDKGYRELVVAIENARNGALYAGELALIRYFIQRNTNDQSQRFAADELAHHG